MKIFNELEKKIITIILNYHDDKTYNCLYNILFDLKTGIIDSSLKVEMYHRTPNNTEIAYRDLPKTQFGLRKLHIELIEKLYTVINLLDYLIAEKLLIHVKDSDSIQFRHSSNGYIIFDLKDSNLQQQLYEYDNGWFIPTSSLRQLADNGFLTQEEIQRRNEQKYNESIRERERSLSNKNQLEIEKRAQEFQLKLDQITSERNKEIEKRAQAFQLKLDQISSERNKEKDKITQKIGWAGIIVPAVSAIINIICSIFIANYIPVTIKTRNSEIVEMSTEELRNKLNNLGDNYYTSQENIKQLQSEIKEQQEIIIKQQDAIIHLSKLINSQKNN